jgi:hypothetical protein
MRIRNVAMPIIGLALAGALVAPVTASSAVPVAPKAVSVASSAKLGLQGASAIITVNYKCAPGTPGAFVSGKLAQNIDGHQLARASAVQSPIVCDGTTHAVRLFMDDNAIPFKKGEAAAMATLGEDGPNAGVISISTGYVPVHLKK